MKRTFILVLVLALVSGPLLAQPNVDARLKTHAELHEKPPHGPLNVLVGKTLDTLPKGEAVVVTGKKAYGGFSGRQVWYEVETNTQKGWIYGGVEGRNTVLTRER